MNESFVISHLLPILLLLTDFCQGNSSPILISSKYWHVFEDDPVGSTVTRLRAHDYEGDLVTFSLESKWPGQDIHSYFNLDKHWRVLVAKPLTDLAGNGSKDYILRVRMNDGVTSPIAEIRLQVLRVTEGENVNGGEPGKVSRARGLGGRHIAGNMNFGSFNNDAPVGYYGILSNSGIGNTFGLVPSFLGSHPPLIQVNRTWIVEADAPIGSLVDTIKVTHIRGTDYNLTLHGTRGLLDVDPVTGRVVVARSLLNQASDLTVMVTVSNAYGDFSEPVVFRVLPLETTSTALPTTSPRSKSWKVPLPEPIEVQGQLIVFDEEDDPSAQFNKAAATSPDQRLAAYTLMCMIMMPILAVLSISSLIVVGFFYHQRLQMRKTMAVMETRSLSYVPKCRSNPL
ncbi:uncharacterized protein [Palaemon carinicauda]|uniref:uncharacterized protein n=1 Tax=Palaemon carinicauda TaxID=392227 RepID=UPI0035B576D4